MSVAIIISTHGAAAEQLLMSVEMLIGKQQNIAHVNFVPGENTDTLIEKYVQKFNELDIFHGVLFFVDIWGGSPFNAANQLIKSKNENKDKYNIITGVNIPMLVAILLARDDNHDFNKLVNTAIENGRAEIKVLNSNTLQNNNKLKKSSIQQQSSSDLSNSTIQDHMLIVLARIDDRLIHGQIVTNWTKEIKVKRIIVVNNEVAKDNIRSTLLKQVAPPGITSHVIDIEKCVRVYNNPKYAGERIMLLFTNPTDVLNLINRGVKIKSINIGGMAYRNGKIQISNAISVDNKDIEAFNKLSKLGIELEVRKLYGDNKINILDLIKKMKN